MPAERRGSRLAFADVLADDRRAMKHLQDHRHLPSKMEEADVCAATTACAAVARGVALPQRPRFRLWRSAIAAADHVGAEAQEPDDAFEDELASHRVRGELRLPGNGELQLVHQVDREVEGDALTLEECQRFGSGERGDAAVVLQHVPERDHGHCVCVSLAAALPC